MSDPFKLSDLDSPLYEHSQIITVQELYSTYLTLAQYYEQARWWQWKLKYDIVMSARVIHDMLEWLDKGKPLNSGEKI